MFLMCGLLPYNFLSNGLNGGMGALIGNGNLVKKVFFPREILVAASTASWLVSFLIELAVLAVALVFFGNVVVLWIPMILVLVALEVVFVHGAGARCCPPRRSTSATCSTCCRSCCRSGSTRRRSSTRCRSSRTS